MKITLSPEQRTRKELYHIIGVSESTFRRRISQSGVMLSKGRLLTLLEQKAVFQLFSLEVDWTASLSS